MSNGDIKKGRLVTFVTDIHEALRHYPDLHLHEDKGGFLIRGTFPVVNDAGKTLDRYQVEISFPDKDIFGLPVVREVAGRIPQISARHINHDGTACICVPAEWLLIAPDRTFLSFLRIPVHNFFLSQSVFEKTGNWPFGERAHGNAGKMAFYRELFSVENDDEARFCLACLAHPKIKGHWHCPCGSKKKFRNCHGEKIRAVARRISKEIALYEYSSLSEKSQ